MSHITRDLIATGPGGPVTWWGALIFVAVIAALLGATYLAIERITRP